MSDKNRYINDRILPRDNESLEEYKIRLYSIKDVEQLTWKQISNLIGQHFNKKISSDYLRHESYATKQKINVEELNVATRILALSDLHYPYNIPVSTFAKYKNKVDILVFNGDIQDCQGISKFAKKYRVPFVDEMAGTRQMIIDIINLIQPKKVVLNYGNHEVRMINYLSNKINEDILELMPETPLDLIVDSGFMKFDRFNNTKVWHTPLVEVYEDTDIEIIYTGNWWCQIGSVIFAHPKAYKSGILGTAEKAWTHFSQLGLDFSTIAMPHTHQVGFAKYGDFYLYETGALCYQQEYATSGGMNKPQSQGYLYIALDKDGNFLYDNTKIELLDIKKDTKVKEFIV